jgi:hypothetical protein
MKKRVGGHERGDEKSFSGPMFRTGFWQNFFFHCFFHQPCQRPLFDNLPLLCVSVEHSELHLLALFHNIRKSTHIYATAQNYRPEENFSDPEDFNASVHRRQWHRLNFSFSVRVRFFAVMRGVLSHMEQDPSNVFQICLT